MTEIIAAVPGSAPRRLADALVVEVNTGIAGSYCGRLLADLGADVIKIESLAGDEVRDQGPFAGTAGGPESSLAFAYLNAGKRSVALDGATGSGQRIRGELLERADIVVFDFEPGCVAQHLGDATVVDGPFAPGVIAVRITPFGLDGSHRAWRAPEVVLDAMGGWTYGIGAPDREPLTPPGHQASIIAGTAAFLGLLSAWHGRLADGLGDVVDVSVQQSIVWFLMNPTTVYRYSGTVWRRRGGSNPTNFPQTLFPCRDGYIGVNVIYHTEWHRFCEFVGHPEWEFDPRFATPLERHLNQAAMVAELEPWLLRFTANELYHAAQDARLPFAKVNTALDLLNSPQLAARDFWRRQQHPVIGTFVQPGSPFCLAGGDAIGEKAAPLLGQHTGEVLQDTLGLEAEAVRALRESRVVR